MGRQVEMTQHHGGIRDEDVAESRLKRSEYWVVHLTHKPTLTIAEESDRTELLAREKAWTALRDRLEGWTH